MGARGDVIGDVELWGGALKPERTREGTRCTPLSLNHFVLRLGSEPGGVLLFGSILTRMGTDVGTLDSLAICRKIPLDGVTLVSRSRQTGV